MGAPVPEPAFVFLTPKGLVDLLISAWHLVDLTHGIALASVVATLDGTVLASFAVTIYLDENGLSSMCFQEWQD